MVPCPPFPPSCAATAARRGTRVHLDGPYGRFSLADDFFSAQDALFIAGGTGIAPIRAMLREAFRRDVRPRCTLVYSARNSDEFAFLPEFRKAARAGLMTLSLSATRHAHSRWRGLSGRLGGAILESVLREQNAPQCYVCGPEGFVTDVRAVLEQLGVTRIRTEEQ
jgi:ferredoxin-NADP reductase